MCSRPALEFLLASDGGSDVAELFAVDEAVDVVMRCVGGGARFAMDGHSAVDVVGYADV